MADAQGAAQPRKQRPPRSRGLRPGLLALCAAAVVAAVALKSSPAAESWLYCSLGLRNSHAAPDSQNASSFEAIDVGTCQLSGTVKDSHCDFASVERLNSRHLLPLLSELVTKPFFRYFKVSLYCDCPFWPDDGMCSLRDCSVCECDSSEVPRPWLAADGLLPPSECSGSEQLEEESTVDRSVEPGMRRQLAGIPGWRGVNNPWMPEDDGDLEFSYINLLENPERYTGYKGEHPHRIWRLIYSQSCFRDVDSLASCPEKRIFYRLISGMHASITSHIVNEYLLDEGAGVWGPNLPAFQARLGNERVSERIENLYFAYLFVLRAVVKAGPYLAGVSYNTGTPAEDPRSAELVQQLVGSAELRAACPVPFDEGRLWKTEDSAALRAQLQRHFRNMTAAMDCVGCEKCKLWGKLQLLGIATSLKILFTSDGCDAHPQPQLQLQLERNEVIALVNLLERLAKSIDIVRRMSAQLASGRPAAPSDAPALGAVERLTHHPLQQTI